MASSWLCNTGVFSGEQAWGGSGGWDIILRSALHGLRRRRRRYHGRIVTYRPHFCERHVQHFEESAGVVFEATRAELESLTTLQADQTRRQLISARHVCPVNQDRDNTDVALQGCLDLQTHKIIRIIKASSPTIIGDRKPLITDQRKQHVAGTDRPADNLDEIVAELYRVDIFEDLSGAEVLCESIEQPAGRVGGFVPPVAYENSTR